jgi:hypothetical protein
MNGVARAFWAELHDVRTPLDPFELIQTTHNCADLAAPEFIEP